MDFEVPEALRDVVDLARSFARADLREAENELDRFVDPLDAFTSETFRSITKKMYGMGFNKLTLPDAVGGLGLPSMAKFLVEQEMAVGGAGLTSQMLVSSIAAAIIAGWGLAGTHPVFREYLDAYVDDDEGVHSSAWTITEPDAGSDIFSFDEPALKMTVKAVQNAGRTGWVIDGAKAAWCTNGWHADMYCLMVNVDPGGGMEGTGTFLIPADWPGVTKGRPIDKVGMRALNQTDIAFDAVEVPNEFLVLPPGPGYRQTLDAFVTSGNTSVGNIALGVAQAAYELGLAYAKERRQGGVPIVEHQLVAKKLFDAYRSIEAARLLLLKSASLISRQQGRPELAFAARVQASETCARVTQDMVLLHGGNGITTEYPVEKLWRDSRPLQIMDGTVDRVTIKGAALL